MAFSWDRRTPRGTISSAAIVDADGTELARPFFRFDPGIVRAVDATHVLARNGNVLVQLPAGRVVWDGKSYLADTTAAGDSVAYALYDEIIVARWR